MKLLRQRLVLLVCIVSAILLIPLIAMQFTNEVSWNGLDFILAAGLFLSVGLAINFIFRKVKDVKSQIVFIVTLIALFLLLWAELAVGILGTPFAGS